MTKDKKFKLVWEYRKYGYIWGMEKIDRDNVYMTAFRTWGYKAQLEMAQEEATELALAVRKHIRKNDDFSFSNLVEEIADVEIMIEQIILMHQDIGLRNLVNQQKEFKINRLNEILEKNKFED